VLSGIKTTGNYVSSRPQTVADAMVHALVSRYPHSRYLVGIDAVIYFRILAWLPDKIVDYILGWPAPYGPLSKQLEQWFINAVLNAHCDSLETQDGLGLIVLRLVWWMSLQQSRHTYKVMLVTFVEYNFLCEYHLSNKSMHWFNNVQFLCFVYIHFISYIFSNQSMQ